MSFLNKKEFPILNEQNFEKEFLVLTKKLVDLRNKKATRQKFKPHEFAYLKKQRAQLLTLKFFNSF